MKRQLYRSTLLNDTKPNQSAPSVHCFSEDKEARILLLLAGYFNGTLQKASYETIKQRFENVVERG